MPRTEHDIDVWQHMIDGHLFDRLAVGDARFNQWSPSLREVHEHLFRPWRYNNSQCDRSGKTPTHAYIALPYDLHSLETHKGNSLQWYDESEFNKEDMHAHPERYLEVPALHDTEGMHETLQHTPHADTDGWLRYHVPATDHESNFLTLIKPRLERIAHAVMITKQFLLTGNRAPYMGFEHDASQRLRHIIDLIVDRPSLEYILQDTLMFLRTCLQNHHFTEWERDFGANIEKHVHADMARHWTGHDQHFTSHRLNREKELRNAPDTFRDANILLQHIDKLLYPNASFSDEKDLATHLRVETDDLLRFVEAREGVQIYFPETYQHIQNFHDALQNHKTALRQDYTSLLRQYLGEPFNREAHAFKSAETAARQSSTGSSTLSPIPNRLQPWSIHT